MQLNPDLHQDGAGNFQEKDRADKAAGDNQSAGNGDGGKTNNKGNERDIPPSQEVDNHDDGPQELD